MTTYHTLCLMRKVRRSGEPDQLAAGLTTVAEARSFERTTRQEHMLVVPRFRTEMGRGVLPVGDRHHTMTYQERSLSRPSRSFAAVCGSISPARHRTQRRISRGVKLCACMFACDCAFCVPRIYYFLYN